MPPPNPRILMINIGLTEEQVLNSFVNANPTIPTPEIATPTTPTPEIKDLSLNQQLIELKVNVLDIWSSDDEEEGRFDLWKEDSGTKARPSKRSEKRKEEAKGFGESKKEEAESEEEETEKQKKEEEGKKEKELLATKRDEKTLTSVWELLINSKAH